MTSYRCVCVHVCIPPSEHGIYMHMYILIHINRNKQTGHLCGTHTRQIHRMKRGISQRKIDDTTTKNK